MANVLGTLIVQLQAETAAFARGMADAKQLAFTTSNEIIGSIERIGKSFEKLRFGSTGEWQKSASIIGGVFAGVAAAAVAGGVVVAKQVADEIASMNKLSKQFGISVTDLSGYRVALKMTGVDMETLATGMSRLAQNAARAEAGGKAQQRTFHDVGIAYGDSAGHLRPMNDLLLDAADKFSKMQDGTAKAALAAQLFGRGVGPQLIPFLNAGRAGIEAYTEKARQLGLVLDEKDAAAAVNLKNNFRLLDEQANAFKERLALEVIPALNGVFSAFLNAADGGNTFAKSLGEFVAGALKITASSIIVLSYSIREIWVALTDFSGEASARVKDLETQMRDRLFAMTDAGQKLQNAIANPAFMKAQADFAEGERKIKAELAAGKLTAEQYAAALDKLAKTRDAAAKKALESPLEGPTKPAPTISLAPSKAAAEQMKQFESDFKLRRAMQDLTLADEANFWQSRERAAAKFPENLQKIQDKVNDIFIRMREETRKLTETIFGGEDKVGELQKDLIESQGKVQEETATRMSAASKVWLDKLTENRAIVDSLNPAVAAYDNYIQRLDNDLQHGVISQETYNQAKQQEFNQLASTYDVSLKTEEAITRLTQAHDKGAVSDENFARQKAALNAQLRMERTLSEPLPGVAGIGAGIGAGAAAAAAQWTGISNEVAKQTVNVANQMSGAMSNAFSEMILGTKSVGKAFQEMGINMLKAVVDAITQMITQWIIYSIIMKAISKVVGIDPKEQAAKQIAANSAQAFSAAGLAAVNTLALTSAMYPPPGPEILAAVTLGVGDAFAAQASFAAGGLLPRDMIVQAHAGEAVLPEKLTSYLMNQANGNKTSAVNAAGHTFNFAIHGATDSRAVGDEVMGRVQRFFKTGGVMKG